MNKVICPNCKREDVVVKRGFFTTQAHGKQQRYYCKSCNHKFIEQTGFYRMRNTPKKVSLCLDLFFRGLSTREVQSHLQAFYPHNSDHSTILRWITRYSTKIAEYTDRLKVNTGSYIEVDEMEYHRRKSHKKKEGIDVNWFIDAIDVKTRFMISSNYARERTGREVKSVLEMIKRKSDNVEIVTTDGFTGYIKPIKKVWGYNRYVGKHNVKHNIVNASHGEGFNIWVERMHNSIRQRTQNFRGFHGSVNSAYSIMKGIEIYYNFIRKHEALKGKTPSDVAIPSLKFETPNRWLELINFSQH